MSKMKTKLFFTAAITIFALASFVLMIFNYNPFKADLSVFTIFYASLFMTLCGVITFLILFIKSRTLANPSSDIFWPSVRQGALFSLIITILLLLQGMRILDLWVGAPLAIAILLLELFFRHSKFKKV